VSAAAVVVLDSQTAELLAAVSISDDAPRVDLTRTARSTGSTLKPFIYAAAFDAGVCTPQTELNDTPAAWAGYAPTNYDREFRGTLSAAEALAESRNLPAMTVLSRVGVRRAVDVMGAMGLTTLSRTPDRFGLPLAIGGAEATPMELAEAYATLARGGNCKPISFTPIACGFADEAVRFAEPPFGSEPQGRRQAASGLLLASSCFAALDCLASPDRTAHVCPEASRSNVAWKTGTSSGHRDAWCAAVTHRRAVVVWLGNANGKGSPVLIGADAAAPAALALIAALDPVDDPWPVTALKEPPRTQFAASAALSIVFPANGSELILSDSAKPQAVQLRCGAHSPTVPWWFVDGSAVGTGTIVEWMPTAGAHEIRALDESGHSALARVNVR
jgi:penicillin-binding protein 1C